MSVSRNLSDMKVKFSFMQILGTVLKNVDIRTLAVVCRLVNHQWNSEACRILRFKITITFSSFEEIDKFNDTFLTSIHPISVTFQSFRFASDFFVTAIENSAYWHLSRLENAVKLFSDLMGTNVFKLEISMYPIYQLEGNTVEKSTVLMFTQLVRMIYDYFSYLKDLKIQFLIANKEVPPEDFCAHTFLDDYSGEILHDLNSITVDTVFIQGNTLGPHEKEITEKYYEENMITHFLRQLLVSSTRVESICSSNVPSEGSPLFHNFLLNNIQLLSSNLTSINVTLNVTDDILHRLISQDHLRIARFRLEIDTEKVSSDMLAEFFTRFKHSLCELHLGFSDALQSSILYPGLPLGATMKSLERLSLEKYGGSLELCQLPKLKDFKAEFCSLREISESFMTHFFQHKIHNMDIDNDSTSDKACLWQPRSQPSASSHLNSLEIIKPCTETFVAFQPEKILTECLSCLPFLSVLRISCIKTVPLSVIFEKCKLLRDLSIQKCGHVVTDEVICGVRASLLKSISPLGIMDKTSDNDEDIKSSGELHDMVAGAKLESQTLRESPFIGNLKGSRKIKLIISHNTTNLLPTINIKCI